MKAKYYQPKEKLCSDFCVKAYSETRRNLLDCVLPKRHSVTTLPCFAGFEVKVDHPHTHVVKATKLVNGKSN